jgi:hypothetical protein
LSIRNFYFRPAPPDGAPSGLRPSCSQVAATPQFTATQKKLHICMTMGMLAGGRASKKKGRRRWPLLRNGFRQLTPSHLQLTRFFRLTWPANSVPCRL